MLGEICFPFEMWYAIEKENYYQVCFRLLFGVIDLWKEIEAGTLRVWKGLSSTLLYYSVDYKEYWYSFPGLNGKR